MKYLKVVLFIFCLYTPAKALEEPFFSKKDIYSILMSSTNISKKKALILIEKMEKIYGSADADHLKISGLLTGSRVNYGFFKNRKKWTFKASFKVMNSNNEEEIVCFKELVRAEVFNGGMILNFISYDFLIIALPPKISLETLDGFDTGRGLSVSTVVPIFNLMIGLIPSELGLIGVFGCSYGFISRGLTFPRLKFYLQAKSSIEHKG